jgi:hypothetical protein
MVKYIQNIVYTNQRCGYVGPFKRIRGLKDMSEDSKTLCQGNKGIYF